MIPVVNVTFTAFDQSGSPIAGGRVTARLDKTETHNGFVVPEEVSATTDASGVAVLQLWPNALGVAGSMYRVRAWNPDTGRKFLDTTISVPNSNCALEQIIVQEPLPPIDAAQQALLAAQGALAAVTAQTAIATNAANTAVAKATAASVHDESAEAAKIAAQQAADASAISASLSGEAQAAAANSATNASNSAAVASGAVTAHEAEADPHPQYTRDDEFEAVATAKVDKIPGKGLSTEDYTTAEKSKLAVMGGAVYWVESYRQVGDTDSEVINRALRQIETDNKPGAVLRFEAGRTYVYDSSHSLGLINDLEIDLNGSLLKRADGASNTAYLTAELATTVPAGITLFLDQIPPSWKVGDLVAAVVGLSNTEVSNPRRITAIDRALKKVTLHYSLDGYTGVGTYPIGTAIVKSWSCFVGRPSSTDSATLLPQGANRRIRIHGGTIDGNRANQVNRSWRYTVEIALHSEGGAIYDCTFKETAGECLSGHGYVVRDNVFVDLGGSAMHTSVHDNTVAVATPLVFTGNTVRRTNLYTQAVNGHSEGAFTFSWGAGHTIITNNLFDGGSEYVLGGFGPSSGTNADRFLIFSNNICKGYKGIFQGLSASIYGVIVTGNDFHDCGDNRTLLASLTAPDNRISDNSASGDTLLAENVPPPTRLDPVEILPAGNTPSVLATGNMLRVRRELSGVSSASHNAATLIVEHNSTNILAMSSGASAYSSINFYAAGQTGFGSASVSYSASTSKLAIGTNTAGGTVEVYSGTNVLAMKFLADGGTVFTQRSKLVCIGDPATDGSWAIDASGADLVFKKRVAGAWVAKQTVVGA